MIDPERFIEWAERRWNGDVIVKGNEVKLNSIFCKDAGLKEDYKHHLWCNPLGGNDECEFGVYHCLKTNTGGTLVSLVMLVDNCSFQDALEILGGEDTTFLELQEKVNAIFEVKVEEFKDVEEIKLQFPPFSYPIDELPSYNTYRQTAEAYLTGRQISIEGLLVCTKGQYRNRIVIPYYNQKGELIYYNTRLMADEGIRYLGPPKEIGVGKSDVLYVPKWPEPGEKLHITEGEFDALSIFAAGFWAAGCGGKELSEPQLMLLRPYKPCLCVDNDKAGLNALAKLGDSLLEKGFKEVTFVRPSQEYKDWNAMLQNLGKRVMAQYIKYREKPYTEWTSLELKTKKPSA